MQPSLTTGSKRIESIDLLRGLIMIIMALDHTRDFFHKDGLTGNPLDPETSYPILYFTRWITHFCAPAFVFLAGLSAWLQGRRKTKGELGIFLVKRGLWLIVFDLTIMTLVLTADIHFDLFILETLWSIGAGLVILGLLIRLPFAIILPIGLVIFFGHNLLDFAEKTRMGNLPVWWKLLHQPGMVPLWGDHNLFIFYPFLSWAGLTLLGYCCGKLFTDVEADRRNKILLGIGTAAIILFVILRFLNTYGDPIPWSTQKNSMATFFSFMNVQKYPPSMLFLCASIGPLMIFLALIKNTSGKPAKFISVYGRVPLFYFVVHFSILHVSQIIVYLFRGHSVAVGMKGLPGLPFKFAIPGEGFTLWLVYVIWILLVIIMYPLCKWYDRYKINHKEKWWLSYL
ncbi:MAG: heparan-alpha-glucosaminide N-acetyltransferase domain-containing protein [Ferruginibacter sp.]